MCVFVAVLGLHAAIILSGTSINFKDTFWMIIKFVLFTEVSEVYCNWEKMLFRLPFSRVWQFCM